MELLGTGLVIHHLEIQSVPPNVAVYTVHLAAHGKGHTALLQLQRRQIALFAEIQFKAYRTEIARLDLLPDIFHHPAGQAARLTEQRRVPRLGLSRGHIGLQVFVDVFCRQGFRLYSLVFAKLRNGMLHHVVQKGADLWRAEPRGADRLCLQPVLQKMTHAAGAHPVQPGGGERDLPAVQLPDQRPVPQRTPGRGGIAPQLFQIGPVLFLCGNRLQGRP